KLMRMKDNVPQKMRDERSLGQGMKDERLSVGQVMRDNLPPRFRDDMPQRFRDDMPPRFRDDIPPRSLGMRDEMSSMVGQQRQDERSFGQGIRDDMPAAQFGRQYERPDGQGFRDERPVQYGGGNVRDDGGFGGPGMRDEVPVKFGRSVRDDVPPPPFGQRDEMPAQFGRNMGDDRASGRNMGDDRAAFGQGTQFREERSFGGMGASKFGQSSFRDEQQQSVFGRDNAKKSHATTDADSDDGIECTYVHGIELVPEVTKPQAEPQKVSSFFKR
ncbi:MAG: hypothetical protein GY696_18685, partial [Gammaproteobacteria bacterium]|nr:hypothetical protein [Gammaproteobacteria bacterium]